MKADVLKHVVSLKNGNVYFRNVSITLLRNVVAHAPYLFRFSSAQLLHIQFIHLWWMALFFFDFIEAVLCARSTLGLMSHKIHFGLKLTN